MHSSIFNSDNLASSKLAVIALLASVLALLAAAEAVTRSAFDRTSRIQKRMHDERALALSTCARRGTQPTLLMVGNSIIMEAVDFGRFQSALSPRVLALRYVVESTTYPDWYYGLKRLFAEGMRPNYVLIGFPAAHLNSDRGRGDFTAFYLFDASGIADYIGRNHVDWTTGSSLMLAHYSEFYAVRSELRSFLINKLFPSFGEAMHLLNTNPAPPDTEGHTEVVATERLRALSELAHRYHTQLIFVVTPTGQSGEEAVVKAGRNSATPVLYPLSAKMLGPRDYADGFHLGIRGRALFTEALIPAVEDFLWGAGGR